MNYTPKEISEALKERPNQAHYIEALFEKAIEQARREMRESCAGLVEEAIANPMISLHSLLAGIRSRSER